MRRIIIPALVLFALAVIGCGKKSSTGPAQDGTTASEYVLHGWANFDSGSYNEAQANFSSAIGKDASLADAYNGKGWCQAILGSPSGALLSFKAGLTHSSANNEIKAGLAFTYAALDSPAQAIDYGAAVLQSDYLWLFSHTYRESPRDDELNYQEICLLLAQQYFKLGQFANAVSWVRKLNPGYTVDTGTIAGQAALLGEIEQLAGTM